MYLLNLDILSIRSVRRENIGQVERDDFDRLDGHLKIKINKNLKNLRFMSNETIQPETKEDNQIFTIGILYSMKKMLLKNKY